MHKSKLIWFYVFQRNDAKELVDITFPALTEELSSSRSESRACHIVIFFHIICIEAINVADKRTRIASRDHHRTKVHWHFPLAAMYDFFAKLSKNDKIFLHYTNALVDIERHFGAILVLCDLTLIRHEMQHEYNQYPPKSDRGKIILLCRTMRLKQTILQRQINIFHSHKCRAHGRNKHRPSYHSLEMDNHPLKNLPNHLLSRHSLTTCSHPSLTFLLLLPQPNK